LFDFPGQSVFSGNKRKINLGSVLQVSQTEALCFSVGKSGYIGSEKISVFPAQLLKFDAGPWLHSPVNALAGPAPASLPLTAWPNPFEDSLHLRLFVPKSGNYTISLYTPTGQIVQTYTRFLSRGNHDFPVRAKIHDLPGGTYFVRLFSPEISGTTTVIRK